MVEESLCRAARATLGEETSASKKRLVNETTERRERRLSKKQELAERRRRVTETEEQREPRLAKEVNEERVAKPSKLKTSFQEVLEVDSAQFVPLV